MGFLGRIKAMELVGGLTLENKPLSCKDEIAGGDIGMGMIGIAEATIGILMARQPMHAASDESFPARERFCVTLVGMLNRKGQGADGGGSGEGRGRELARPMVVDAELMEAREQRSACAKGSRIE